jgi:tyrosine aminotransferase
LKHLESLIDDKTAVIIINNPSNPCSSNFTWQHLQDILLLAEQNFLPIISDEIYGGLTWTDYPFTPLHTIPSPVPIITIDGLAKKFVIPGWRLGWLFFHDRGGAFKSVRGGVRNLSQVDLHPNSIIQAALPQILQTPEEYFDSIRAELKRNAMIMGKGLADATGLHFNGPQGSLYAWVNISEPRLLSED